MSTDDSMMANLTRTGHADFDRFWAAYPKRVARKDALKAWLQINPTPEMVAQILEALTWQRNQPAWMKNGGQFIPHAGTWLRAERWTDEPFHAPQLSDRTIALLRAGDDFLREM